MKRDYAGTDKQVEICKHILAWGGPMPFEELKKKVSWTCTGPALQCSIRVLMQHGFLTRVYGYRKALTLVPNQKMSDWYG